jgi:hypothetical protein
MITVVACIAYADDVTAITGQQDVKKLSRILQIYEQATGARVNWDKTGALPIGRSDRAQDIGRARYTEVEKILGISFGANIGCTIDYAWKEKVQKIQGCVEDFPIRKLDIKQRLRISNTWYL